MAHLEVYIQTTHPLATTASRAAFEQGGVKMDDKSKCDKCGELYPHTKLDAVFLNASMTEASDEAYCQTCFPSVRRFKWDQWSSLDTDLSTPVSEA